MVVGPGADHVPRGVGVSAAHLAVRAKPEAAEHHEPWRTSRPISFARRPKSRIICGVALGDMNVEKTPIFILLLPRL